MFEGGNCSSVTVDRPTIRTIRRTTFEINKETVARVPSHDPLYLVMIASHLEKWPIAEIINKRKWELFGRTNALVEKNRSQR